MDVYGPSSSGLAAAIAVPICGCADDCGLSSSKLAAAIAVPICGCAAIVAILWFFAARSYQLPWRSCVGAGSEDIEAARVPEKDKDASLLRSLSGRMAKANASIDMIHRAGPGVGPNTTLVMTDVQDDAMAVHDNLIYTEIIKHKGYSSATDHALAGGFDLGSSTLRGPHSPSGSKKPLRATAARHKGATGGCGWGRGGKVPGARKTEAQGGQEAHGKMSAAAQQHHSSSRESAEEQNLPGTSTQQQPGTISTPETPRTPPFPAAPDPAQHLAAAPPYQAPRQHQSPAQHQQISHSPMPPSAAPRPYAPGSKHQKSSTTPSTEPGTSIQDHQRSSTSHPRSTSSTPAPAKQHTAPAHQHSKRDTAAGSRAAAASEAAGMQHQHQTLRSSRQTKHPAAGTRLPAGDQHTPSTPSPTLVQTLPKGPTEVTSTTRAQSPASSTSHSCHQQI
eukprot:gene21878-28912_t